MRLRAASRRSRRIARRIERFRLREAGERHVSNSSPDPIAALTRAKIRRLAANGCVVSA
jgi:hypothetical protein